MEIIADDLVLTWSDLFRIGLQDALSIANLILPAVLGWFAGAGKKSFVVGLTMFFALPVAMHFVLAEVLRLPSISLTSFGVMEQIALASYIGATITGLVVFMVFCKARSWRRSQRSRAVEVS